MSTRPRCRARPSIEAPSAGSTISGNRVTMSIFIWFAVGAPAPGRLTQARLDRPQGRLACGCASASGLRLALRPDGRRITARLQLEQAGRRPDHDPPGRHVHRSEEHTSELQSRLHLVCRLLLEKKKNIRLKDTLNILT